MTTSELLGAWERGLNQHPIERALVLLAAIRPETSADELAKLSIGQRDASLLTLRERAFGSQLTCLTVCGSCGESLELNFEVEEIRAGTNPPETLELEIEGYSLGFRLPNTLDLRAIADSADVGAARDLLLQRCLMRAERDGERTSAAALPASVIEILVERMGQADPQADVQLEFSCPQCGHQWHTAFDIVSFFWSELNSWAHRTLRDVHTLARAYGWRESEILSLSPVRRQLYLEMVH